MYKVHNRGALYLPKLKKCKGVFTPEPVSYFGMFSFGLSIPVWSETSIHSHSAVTDGQTSAYLGIISLPIFLRCGPWNKTPLTTQYHPIISRACWTERVAAASHSSFNHTRLWGQKGWMNTILDPDQKCSGWNVCAALRGCVGAGDLQECGLTLSQPTGLTLNRSSQGQRRHKDTLTPAFTPTGSSRDSY